MDENGRLEYLLRRYRSVGLLFLCVIMLGAGSIKMNREAVESGSRKILQEPQRQAAKIRLTAEILERAGNPQALLDILKKYHDHGQLILGGEYEKNQEIRWFIEYGR